MSRGIARIDSPVGEPVLAATARGLTHVLFATPGCEEPCPSAGGMPIVEAAATQLRAYFAGTLRASSSPSRLPSSPSSIYWAFSTPAPPPRSGRGRVRWAPAGRPDPLFGPGCPPSCGGSR